MPIKSFLAHRASRRSALHRKGKTHIGTRVVIKKPLSWQKRLLWGGLIAVAAILAGVGLFLAGQYSAGYASIDSALALRALKNENGRLRADAEALSERLEATTTQLHIEQGARKSMDAQIVKLETERNRLNRDLALFDNLIPSNGDDDRPSIRGFSIEPAGVPDNPRAWRYRLLIMRPGKALDSFVGDIRLQVRYSLDGREILAATAATGKIEAPLEFTRYQRIEGQFQAPAGAKLLGAVARVMENGKPVAESIHQP